MQTKSRTVHTPINWDEVGPELLEACKLALGINRYNLGNPIATALENAVARAEGRDNARD